MTSIESVREAISKRFEHVVDLGGGVIRGNLVHEDKPYAVAYVDLSDSVVERSRDLTSFQEQLLGAAFFSPDSDLRWNSYLFFLAGPKSVASDQFGNAKARIEADRHFARKFVLDADDLILRFRDPASSENDEPAYVVDVGATWATLLRSASLGSLLEQPARTTALDQIANGEAFKAEPAPSAAKPVRKADPLANGVLRNLKIGSFRRINQGASFSFGDVNLIVGANGTGKTSLLEAIEALYCGRVRRDPEASFTDIVGILDNGQGKLEPVTAPAAVSVLKERNILWYGRADFQSNSITQGFSRFNFLDTDAAFRMSSDRKYEDIKQDLSKLLVGPEASKLWDYLSKLFKEAQVRLTILNDRLPDQIRAVELLAGEVNRLRDAPSEATTLLAAYRSSLARLAPSGTITDDRHPLNTGEREKLEALVHATRLVQSAVSETPVTREKVERRATRLREGVAVVKQLHKEYETSLRMLAEIQQRFKSNEKQQTQLRDWLRLLEARVPALAASIGEAEGRATRLRRLLRDQPTETLSPVPAEYIALALDEAQRISAERLGATQRQENEAELALSHSIKLGQSLDSLRRDLHDTAIAYMERSGEAALCPVCKTEHSPSELVTKLEELVASQGAGMSESLRRNAQLAREQTGRYRQDAIVLAALAKYAEASEAPKSALCGMVQDQLRKSIAELSAVTVELQSNRNALSGLALEGVDWSKWDEMRDSSIMPLLPPGSDPQSEAAITETLDVLRERASDELEAARREQEHASMLAQQMAVQVAREIDDQTAALGHSQKITTLERTLHQVERALLELDGIARLLQLPPTASIEDVETELEGCLLAFDRAHHALQADAQASATLQEKTRSHKSAAESLAADTITRGNLIVASETLSKIVERYSIDRATADAFSAIKDRVSDVFARIHSPQEYELGDFTSETLIIRRDNKKAHAVNQVSTGQRAALALAVFLALNESAETAPRIILIDDPVAHIDDLNALSFLDYLREVALHSGKQIFFATADIRLAALFQRKFEFLGQERFKRISLPLPVG